MVTQCRFNATENKHKMKEEEKKTWKNTRVTTRSMFNGILTRISGFLLQKFRLKCRLLNIIYLSKELIGALKKVAKD